MTLIAPTSLPMKYTQVKKMYPPSTYPDLVPLAANTYLNPLSGRFLTISAGTYALSSASDTQIAGWTDSVNSQNSTGTGSVAGDAVELIDDSNAIFELPIVGATITAATLLSTYQNKCFDLVQAGSGLTLVQQANLAANTKKHFKVVGGNVARQTVYVKINPTLLFTA
jgi:hypothetical protein